MLEDDGPGERERLNSERVEERDERKKLRTHQVSEMLTFDWLVRLMSISRRKTEAGS